MLLNGEITEGEKINKKVRDELGGNCLKRKVLSFEREREREQEKKKAGQ